MGQGLCCVCNQKTSGRCGGDYYIPILPQTVGGESECGKWVCEACGYVTSCS
jgi:hypothetical protein